MKSFRICMQNIRKWGSNSRIKMCLVFAMLFVYTYTSGLGEVCEYLGEDISPWIFPFLFTTRYIKILFMMLIVFIFCDAPFIDSNQTYVMLRTKRSTWCIGQIMYIFVGSLLYSLLLLVMSVVVHIGHMEWNTSWGRVIGTAGTTSILGELGIYYNTVGMPGRVIRYFTPFQAMLFSFVLMWLSFVFIGLVTYVLNVLTKTKLVGVLVSGFFVVLTAVVDGFPRYNWFSPISWNSLNNIDIGGMTTYPTIEYILGMYIGSIVIMSILVVVIGKKQEIIVREDM